MILPQSLLLLFSLPLLVLSNPPPTGAAQTSPIPSNPPPGNLQVDDDVCPDYETCSTKGHAYWKTLQATLANSDSRDRTDGLSLFNAYYKASFDYTSPADPDLHQDLLNHGIEADQLDRWTTYDKKSSTSAMGHFFAPYENIFDTYRGAIIAEANYRDWDAAKKLPWSELMYITYQFASRYADNENLHPLQDDDEPPHPPGGPIANLKHVIQHIVVNAGTKTILRNAYESNKYPVGADKVNDEGVWRQWTMKGSAGFFTAMLGTDNVKGVVWLLNDHAVEMGRKEVVEIWTRWDGEHPDIW
ncbi:MAG: hypothetical protein LQ352_004675 [Teloschistes flavicans]|nr:MAG: hypothetical protein LQ352_004675 [Teloschistes flavicans]